METNFGRLNFETHETGSNSTSSAERICRVNNGLCPECGNQTHAIKRKYPQRVKIPLTIEKKVDNGRCLFCHPLSTNANANASSNTSVGQADSLNNASHGPLTCPPLFERFVPMGSLWGGSSDDRFGWSVSLSGQGDMLAVASPWHNDGGLSKAGLIQVFERREANHRWEEIFNITGEAEYDKVGWNSLSLSGDGKRMIFGSYKNYRGYAKIVDVESGRTLKLVGDNEDDEFGGRVSISNSGNHVAVAARKYIRVFEVLDDGTLTQVGKDIAADWAPRVALSAEGDILGIGEPYHDDGKGRGRIMKWDGTKWGLVGKEIIGEDDKDEFGVALDLSANGQRVLIGTWEGNYVKSYNYDGAEWKVLGEKLEGGNDDNGEFGWSVSLSGDGNKIVLGSPSFTSDGLYARGRALVYQYHDNTWKQIGADIVGEKAFNYAGVSVTILGDGHFFALGIPDVDSEGKKNVGSVVVYKIE